MYRVHHLWIQILRYDHITLRVTFVSSVDVDAALAASVHTLNDATLFFYDVFPYFLRINAKKTRSATAPVEPASFRSEIKKRSCKFITLLKCY